MCLWWGVAHSREPQGVARVLRVMANRCIVVVKERAACCRSSGDDAKAVTGGYGNACHTDVTLQKKEHIVTNTALPAGAKFDGIKDAMPTKLRGPQQASKRCLWAAAELINAR
ncbi:hypothetical protein HaLaN_24035 [Haematococcus lacustris]|uniref:Uncharacterized protein n=1 Tax=Haematococcus lacustris TaxID=44745 RepID=A0A699ZCJ0_HAELA|nr:hypothetical protein HaLaN_13447 [Haematococcus lacustris]GFH25974.1 hypothetical protein HaLaN_24035 [Haematococcus lacustris]